MELGLFEVKGWELAFTLLDKLGMVVACGHGEAGN